MLHDYIEKARFVYDKYHRKKAFLSFYYGIYSYIKYFKNRINNHDIAFFNLLLRYTVHDYETALEIRSSFDNRNIPDYVLKDLDSVFGDITHKIMMKNEYKQNPSINGSNKNILFIFGESDDQTVALWQHHLYNLAYESGVKDLSPESIDDFYISEMKNHNLIKLCTYNYKNVESLLETIPSNPDVIFIVSHGDLQDDPGFNMKFGNSFPPLKTTNVNMNWFCESLKSRIVNNDCALICFACGSKNLTYNGFKNKVLCGDSLTELPLMAYSFSFLSSLMFDENFKQIHNRSKIITQLLSSQYKMII